MQTLFPLVSVVQFKLKTTLLFQKLLQKRFYLDHLRVVSTRISKFAYGFFIRIAYDSSIPDHRYRSQDAFTNPQNLLVPEALVFQYYPSQSESFVPFQKLEYVI